MATAPPEMNFQGKGWKALLTDQAGLIQFWSVRLPEILGPWVPRLADSFADGAWMANWPKAAAKGPLATLVVGFLAPFIWPGMHTIYSESLIFLILASASSILSGSLGAALLLGYVAGDLAHELFRTFLYSALGHLVGYLLLAILLIRIPRLARRLAGEVQRFRSGSKPRLAMRAVLYGGSCAVLVFLWCQATIVLIRPVFTWSGSEPTDDAVMQVQVRWPWLVAFAVLAGIARILLEDFSVSRSPGAPLVAELRARRRTTTVRSVGKWQRLSTRAQVALGAIFLTVILAGTYAGWIDPIIVLVVTGTVGAWRAGLVGKMARGWMNPINKIPVVLRAIVVLVVGFLISDLVVTSFWGAGSLRPVMVGALITVVLFYVMFPRSEAGEKASDRPEEMR